MGTSPGVDDELATEVVPSINLTNTPHHTAYIRSFWRLEMRS